MRGGRGRLTLSVAVRIWRHQRASAVIRAASSHTSNLLELRAPSVQPGKAGICVDQSLVPKSLSETSLIFGGVGVRTYSQTIICKAAVTTVLEQINCSKVGGRSCQISVQDLQLGRRGKCSLGTSESNPKVVFVLGGPGSGKGTQCQKIVDNYGFVHLSAGDLLRAEIQSGTKYGDMIQNMIKEGKIVPSEVTTKLLLKAMKKSSSDKFLIDGFPRNDENRAVFEKLTGIVPEFILFFDCPEDEMERRVLGRNQGRVDDNPETMQKRLNVFKDISVPVVKYYESMGKVHKIIATGNVDDIFSTIQQYFEPFVEKQNCEQRMQSSTQQLDSSPVT